MSSQRKLPSSEVEYTQVAELMRPPPLPAVSVGQGGVSAHSAEPSAEKRTGHSGIQLRVRGRIRVLSLLALLVTLTLLGGLGNAAFHAIHDPLVAPIVLSPDSDLVLPSKLTLSRMITEQSDLQVRMQNAEGALQADEQAIARLKRLKLAVADGLGWTDDVTAQAETSITQRLRLIAAQKQLIERSIVAQRSYVDELEKSLAAGLVHRTDVLREKAELSRQRLAALQMERERLAGVTELHESSLAQVALHAAGKESHVLSPEILRNSDQATHIELELLKLETDQRARVGELRSLREQARTSRELISQIKARPVFRAVEAEQNVAFVPYTQIRGVHRGAALYDCALWSLFFCERVGEVKELLPGEVSMQDPWGAPARGQYALLRLSAADAAKAKVLHVRAPETSTNDRDFIVSTALPR